MTDKQTEKPEKQSFPSMRDWLAASRPQYYIATIIPVTLGFILAGHYTGEWRFFIFLLLLLASFFVHLAANLANDVFDQDSGVDTDQSIGGSLARREGRISRRYYILALITLYSLYLLLAPFIIIPSGQPILWLFAAFGIFSSIFYTAPPFKFAYRALGEALVFLNMGIVMVCGSYMACAHNFRMPVLAFGVIIGLMVAAILYFQNLPEIDTDAAAGKRTLAVRLGMEKAFLLYIVWWPVTWLLVTMLWFTDNAAWPALLWICAIPFYLKCVKALQTIPRSNLLELDEKGYLVRIMYLLTGVSLILGVIFLQ